MHGESETSPQNRAETSSGFEAFLDGRTADSLRVVLPAGGILYLLLAAAHPFFLPPQYSAPLSLLATVSACACLAGSYLVWMGRLSPARVEMVGIALAVLTTVDILLHLYLTRAPRETTSLALLLVGVSLIFKKRSTAYVLLALPLPFWLWIGQMNWSPEWTHFGFMLLLTEFLAVVCFESNRRTLELLFGRQGYLMDLAQSDSLTRLANRWGFRRRLGAAFADREAGYRREFAVCLVDVDDFKQINDTYGHPEGDRVLRAIAVALHAACAPQDFAARLGGDEFVVFLDGVESEAAARRASARLRRAASVDVDLAGSLCEVAVSVGVVWSGEGAANVEALMAKVDAEMYRDKRRPREDSRAAPSSDGPAKQTVLPLTVGE